MAHAEDGHHFKHVPSNREQLARALGATETPVFNAQDTKKLKQFETTASSANTAEGMLANGHIVPVVEVGLGGQTTKSTLNETSVSKMKHAAFDLYYDHLRPDPQLKQEAQAILKREQQAGHDRHKDIPDVKQLNTVWELPAYKAQAKDVDDEERSPR